MIELMHILAGLGVGVLLGLTGVGGGALLTPLLLLLFGVAPKTAVGTDLLFAAITKMVGVSIHGIRGSVDWRVVAFGPAVSLRLLRPRPWSQCSGETLLTSTPSSSMRSRLC